MTDYATHRYGSQHGPPASSGGGLDIKTLLITAVASAIAAYTCSRIWAPGTLAAAAFTPVIVALAKEALAKSTEVVVRAVPVRGVVRSAEVQGPQPPDASWSQGEGEPLGGDFAPPAPAAAPALAPASAGDPAMRVAQPGEIQYHSSRRGLRGWRLAVVTGLLGFLICAVVFTVPELVAGGSASGGGRDTTLFGGGSQRDRNEPAVTTQTTTVQVETVTTPSQGTVTVPPPKTVTVPPPAVTTTTPVPTQTTTVPVQPGVEPPPPPG
ncbi:MAG: hypothetical protein QOE08_1777 [Thermoleophilaceae bacterium]|jgi:hypothetical protein|nr:hypothetical protein [Thermoleophilaceae bacterium]